MSTTTYPIHIPSELHPATAKLVASFAEALSEKLAAAERKYGYSDGWADKGWMDECRAKLIEHVHKGDPRDVAAYCAFLWHHGERTALEEQFIYDVLGKWPGVSGNGKAAAGLRGDEAQITPQNRHGEAGTDGVEGKTK